MSLRMQNLPRLRQLAALVACGVCAHLTVATTCLSEWVPVELSAPLEGPAGHRALWQVSARLDDRVPGPWVLRTEPPSELRLVRLEGAEGEVLMAQDAAAPEAPSYEVRGDGSLWVSCQCPGFVVEVVTPAAEGVPARLIAASEMDTDCSGRPPRTVDFRLFPLETTPP